MLYGKGVWSEGEGEGEGGVSWEKRREAKGGGEEAFLCMHHYSDILYAQN